MSCISIDYSFFLNDAATTEIYTLSLHDALPIWEPTYTATPLPGCADSRSRGSWDAQSCYARDRKSTRLNSSHLGISYAVFCLKKKKQLHFHRPRSGGYGYQFVGRFFPSFPSRPF